MASGSWYSIPCRIAEMRLDITLACGQSFRWREVQQGVWRSVLSGKIWTVKQTDHEILYQVHNTKVAIPSSAVIKSEPTGAKKFRSKTDAVKNIKKEVDPTMVIKSEPTGGAKNKTKTAKSKTAAVKNVKKVEDPADISKTIKTEVDSNHRDVLTDYFQLDVNLGSLYKQWQAADGNFRQVAADFPGVRILRQDPTENLFAFICSSNNNISRITSMVEKLCVHYGEKVGCVDDEDWHGFPPVAALAHDSVEQHLRELGFGYRAKFINQTAKIISQKDDGWLDSLRRVSYEKAHTELLQLTGVGAKVADCVCLMSLDKTGAIPVDTHVWQIAARDYMPKLAKTKTLTDKIYMEIGDHFRGLFGDYAGWAHSVLFSADLKKFKKEQSSPAKAKRKVAVKHGSSGDASVDKAKKPKKTPRLKKK